jgi:hypothetical protein
VNAAIPDDEPELALVRLVRTVPALLSALPPTISHAMQLLILGDMLPTNPTLLPEFTDLVLSSIGSQRLSDVRAAFFAVAACVAVFPPPTALSFLETAIATLKQFEGDEEQFASRAIDGAAVAIGALILHGAVLQAEELSLWFRCLPIVTDSPEASIACAAVLAVAGPDGTGLTDRDQLSGFLAVAADIPQKTRIDADVQIRFRALLRAVLAAVGDRALRWLSPAQRWAARAFAV